ncbi:hypothetical protein VC888_12950 [Citrobacter freundii]|nr:hypothetical protein [Citrobacter freundii]
MDKLPSPVTVPPPGASFNALKASSAAGFEAVWSEIKLLIIRGSASMTVPPVMLPTY